MAWLKATDTGHWEMTPQTGIAHRTEPLVSGELDSCAACHSRRKVIEKNPVPGTRFLNSYLPAGLRPDLYHPDGQIDGEVFEYGSFLQSRMHHAGVTCSDCHEPHGLGLRAEGNALCAQCHMPAKFDVVEHHHHTPGSVGAACTSCHMPAKTYMIVDPRRDHSLRVPRPDLSVSLGTPNACTQCHGGKSAEWAAAAVAAWFPHGRQTTPHFGTALQAGRTGAADAEQQLDRLILDPGQPAIARATALSMLATHLSPASASAIKAAIVDPDPLVRSAAPAVLAAATTPDILQAMAVLLSDPVRAVRIEAARALAGTNPQALAEVPRNAFGLAFLELVAAEAVDADRPEAHLNLGLLYTRQGQAPTAEAEYRTALRLDPQFVPAMANLADLDRMLGMDQQGADLLRRAMALEPNNADVRHSLGLLLVRQRNYAGALPLLRQASELAPANPRYAYVYAIALNSTGATHQALTLLEQTHQGHPADRDVLGALVAIARASGDQAKALIYARALGALDPANPRLRQLINELDQQQVR